MDEVLVRELGVAQRVCLGVATLVATLVLAGWLIPPVRVILPAVWPLMKANTCLGVLLSVGSLGFSRRRRPGWRKNLSRAMAVAVSLLGALDGAEYIFHTSLKFGFWGVDTLLATDPWGTPPGRMSPQTAVAFVLLGLAMALLPLRKRVFVYATDLYVCCLCLLVLIVGSGYLFQAMHLFGVNSNNRTAPQTLLCLMMLSFVVFGRQAEQGIFSILLGAGIGSRIARIVMPIALLLPFVLEAAKGLLIHENLFQPEYATAVATALGVVLAFGLILVLAWRIDRLESSIRDLSLRDELTGLYNRRGFYVLAEQAFLVAKRSGLTLSVLFIDVDDLKMINDRFGHEEGSALLHEVAEFLKESFRKTDVLGRIGGDEFVVAAVSSEKAMHAAIERLERGAAERSAQQGRKHPFSFSHGSVTSEVGSKESLEDLLSRADALMYEKKRTKKAHRGNRE